MVIKFWNDILNKEEKRKEILKLVLTSYLRKKIEIYGKSANIDKTLLLISNYISKENL